MVLLPNPKLRRRAVTGRSSWYPYYAGFSFDFAVEAIRAGRLSTHSIILDPWNGGGTTTWAANSLGLASIGIDLNPVMVVAAKARAISVGDRNSLNPIGVDITAKASRVTSCSADDDPLSTWFVPRSVESFRSLSYSLQQLLVSEEAPVDLTSPEAVTELSDLAAFYYVALFRTVRSFLRPFVPSNPMWIKRPRNPAARLHPRPETITERFRLEVAEMVSVLEAPLKDSHSDADIELRVGSSTSLPLVDGSVDFVLSSPPYCTRIDYAVATMPELAILGFHPDHGVEELRRRLIGTSTVQPSVGAPDTRWGGTCIRFLQAVLEHGSKASSTYYYKNHHQYFAQMFESLTELRRVLKTNAQCVMVVQDSYYKDVHNDLPRVICEMMEGLGFVLEDRIDYTARSLMAHIHPGARAYRSHRKATESILSLRKVVA